MKLVFVRHGKDDDRYRGGWNQLDILPEGVEQSRKLAKHFKEKKKNYNIFTIISSDLQRTISTAQIVAKELGITIIDEPRLREINNGVLAGMLNDEALVKYPGLFFNSLEMDEAYPEGESPIEFYSRVKEWFEEFVCNEKQSNENVLIVTHSGVINIIYHLVADIPWSNKTIPFKASNCGVHVLNTVTMKLELKNQTDFLKN